MINFSKYNNQDAYQYTGSYYEHRKASTHRDVHKTGERLIVMQLIDFNVFATENIFR